MHRRPWTLCLVLCLLLSGCGHPQTATLPSWAEQFQYVESQITARYPGYTVQRITADGSVIRGRDALFIRLEFADAAGNQVQWRYDDWDVRGSLKEEASGYEKSTTLPQVATITIHPRDVLTRTATHRASYQGTAPLDDLRWHINLVEGTYIPGGEQSPVVWDVSYHLLFGDADLHVYVDAHTGAIIHQETITW